MSAPLSKKFIRRLFLGDGGNTVTEVTATASEINAKCDVSAQAVVNVTDAATYSLLAANTGKLHVLPDMTAACTISLPAEAAGLSYKFIYGGAADDANGIVLDTGNDLNYFIGGLVHLDNDAGAAGIEVVSVYSDNDSNSKITCTSVGAGTVIELFCDGTNWYVNGQVVGDNVPAFADQ